ncbi:hypothetical protein RN001_014063 [Aquatica leii]|uniref:Uncharacterized protein n=1 Tax=Aquatica leii TaxID=1421715 RepID=A0AAN7P3M5_9COLE|nr:hypothetical protein RN001_014063 [Aquatica leii]
MLQFKLLNLLPEINLNIIPHPIACNRYADSITEADIKSTEKVLLNLRPKLSEVGIDTNIILPFINSMLTTNTEINFSEDEINAIEVILTDEPINTNNKDKIIVILPDILIIPASINSDDNKNSSDIKLNGNAAKINKAKSNSDFEERPQYKSKEGEGILTLGKNIREEKPVVVENLYVGKGTRIEEIRDVTNKKSKIYVRTLLKNRRTRD